MFELLLDRARRRRSPATMPGFHAGRPPRNKGLRYPPNPPKVEEIIAVMRPAGDGGHGRRLRGLIVIMWRAGLRTPGIARSQRGRSWSTPRLTSGPVREGRAPSRARHGPRGDGNRFSPGLTSGASSRSARCSASSTARRADATGHPPRHAPSSGAPPPQRERRRFAPHQLRHAHAVEMAREGVPLSVIQRQLGHGNLGITSVYLQGIDSGEIVETVHARRAPVIPVSASLRL
jgi:integrase